MRWLAIFAVVVRTCAYEKPYMQPQICNEKVRNELLHRIVINKDSISFIPSKNNCQFMKSQIDKKNRLQVKTINVISFLLIIVAITTLAFKNNTAVNTAPDDNAKQDSIESVAAFKEVYKVLKHPRCMNCHPAGNIPLQGDDSHIHAMFPKRGKDGHGLYAMKCTNCHQPENTPGLHTPPGNPKWALPSAEMKMVFQGKTAHQLAIQIMDYNRNGHKNKQQLLEHARDTLVKAAWAMGEGRKAPPLSYNEFVKQWDTWINKGAYAPKP